LARQSPHAAHASVDGDTDVGDLLRHLGVIVFRRAADSTLRFLEVDGPCSERMGLSTATLTGDAYSFWTRVDAADRRRVLSALEEAIRKGCEYRISYRLHPPSGRVRAVREEGVAERGPDGGIVALRGVILEAEADLDGARMEQAVADLEESRERFRALAEQSGEMIAEISPERLVSFASPRLCEELGTSADELTHRDALALVHPDDRDHVIGTALETIRTGEVGEVLCRLERGDGGWLWVEMAGRCFRGASGECHAIATARNVENRVAVEESLLAQRLAEARIGKLTQRFMELGSEELDAAIEEGLEAAAAIGGADRCYLMAFETAEGERRRVYCWQRDGLDTWGPAMGQMEDPRNDWMRDRLLRGEVLRIPKVRELPEVHAGSRRSLLERDIQSYCVIPVRSEGRVSALLGFQAIGQEQDWTEQEIALLRLVAELFSSALRRRACRCA